MDQFMQNPQMMQMAQTMMQDPEVMQMMQQPGMMEKIQAAMSDPSLAMSDPDVMKIIMKLQGMGMGGGGGMGGGMGGGFGGGAPATAPSGPSPHIQHIKTPAQHASALAAAGDKLVVVNYSTTWCGPCKAIAPLVNELSLEYKDKVTFVKVDGDHSRELCLQQGIQGFPTFEFYVRGQKIESFTGADREKLRRIVEEYGNYEPPPPPCPYKHFPLREAELVKYPDMKWEMVTPKFKEFNEKFPSGDANALTENELKSLDALLKIIQDKSSYHSSTITPDMFAVTNKLLSWPKENLGPVVNFIRMAVFHPGFAKYYADESNKTPGGEKDLIPRLLKIAHSSEKPVQAMLCVRTFVNCFSRRVLGKAVAARYEEILESVSGLYKKYSDENLRLSIIALYINFSILFTEDSKFYEQAKILMLTSIQEALQQQPIDPKITYRCLVILGTLVYQDSNATELCRDLDLFDTVQSVVKHDSCKSDEPTQQVTLELQQALKK